jgi:glycerol uptake facilitator-like aquaporin
MSRRETAPSLQTEWRRYGAELLGTLVLVLGGTTAIVAAERAPAPVLLVAPEDVPVAVDFR